MIELDEFSKLIKVLSITQEKVKQECLQELDDFIQKDLFMDGPMPERMLVNLYKKMMSAKLLAGDGISIKDMLELLRQNKDESDQ